MSLVYLAGWIGALLVVAAYAAITVGTPRHPAALHLANLIGSAGLATVAFANHTWPSVFVNGIWLAIAGAALVRAKPARRRGPRKSGRDSGPGVDRLPRDRDLCPAGCP
jgi:hypothetical protein